MSAYIVDKETIDLIVYTLTMHEAVRDSVQLRHYFDTEPNGFIDETKIGQRLLASNAASVAARYNEPAANEVILDYRYSVPRFAPAYSIVELIKNLHAYYYQCAYAPDWDESSTNELIVAAERMLVVALPGYDEAAWGIGPYSLPMAATAEMRGKPWRSMKRS